VFNEQSNVAPDPLTLGTVEITILAFHVKEQYVDEFRKLIERFFRRHAVGLASAVNGPSIPPSTEG
jgi:hypothetical protein